MMLLFYTVPLTYLFPLDEMCFFFSLGAVPVQRCNMFDVQLLSKQQEFHCDQDHLRLHLTAVDHRRLHHAITGCG